MLNENCVIELCRPSVSNDLERRNEFYSCIFTCNNLILKKENTQTNTFDLRFVNRREKK